MEVIYADELFVKNAALDYLLLLSAARLRGAPLRRGRFVLAAAAGGLYAVLAALPPLRPLRSGCAAVGVSLLMGLLAYGAGPGLWKSWGCFLALGAAFAGAVFALGRLTGEDGMLLTASPRAVLLVFGAGYAAVRLLSGRRAGAREILTVTVALSGRRVEIPALRDTGNELFDPAAGRRVMVADPAALAPLFDPPLPLPLPEDPAERFRRLCARPELRGRLHLVAYSALGTRRALLCCFRPDGLRAGGEERSHLVAFSPGPVEGDGYRAVL